jgi:hypothetical protein
MEKKDFTDVNYTDLLNNYEFKVASKILKKQFPFIKRIYLKKPEEINKYSLIFLDFDVDPDLLKEFYDRPLASFVNFYLDRGQTFWSPYLSVLFHDGNNTDPKFNSDQFDSIFDSVHDSQAIPQNLKLPKERKLRTGSFQINP